MHGSGTLSGTILQNILLLVQKHIQTQLNTQTLACHRCELSWNVPTPLEHSWHQTCTWTAAMMLHLSVVTSILACTDSLNVLLFTQMYASHKVSLLEDGVGISRVMLMQQQQVQVQEPQDAASPQVCCWV